jgi:hypothetical protein
MGGYRRSSGKAWRLWMPEEFTTFVKRSNNPLEFIASDISMWIEILHGAQENSCILSFADNTAAVGWLHKANVNEAQKKPLQAATRYFASLLIKADCCL